MACGKYGSLVFESDEWRERNRRGAYAPRRYSRVGIFRLKCELGENGLEKVLGCGEMDSFEKVQVSNATAELKASIEKGVEFANAPAAEK